jgi:hypothetical protein
MVAGMTLTSAIPRWGGQCFTYNMTTSTEFGRQVDGLLVGLDRPGHPYLLNYRGEKMKERVTSGERL